MGMVLRDKNGNIKEVREYEKGKLIKHELLEDGVLKDQLHSQEVSSK